MSGCHFAEEHDRFRWLVRLAIQRTSAMMPTAPIAIYKEATAKVRLLERRLGYALSDRLET
jgi:hypothetical protein